MREEELQAACDELAGFMRRLYERGLTTTSGGNLSRRLADGRVLITASGTDKGRMTGAEVAVLDAGGGNQTPSRKPSIETSMHLEILRVHARVGAVVHAHPPSATAFAVAGRVPNCRLMAEAYALIGEPAVAPYALMGTPDLAQSVAGSIGPHTACVLMENHGVLAVGRTVLEAFDFLEVLENVARIHLAALTLGTPRELTADRCRALDAFMGRRPA